MGPDEILLHCIFENKRLMMISEAHAGVVGGHYARKTMVHNIFVRRIKVAHHS